MGLLRSSFTMKTLICLAVFITIAYALPNTDSVVPEVELVEDAVDWRQTVAQEAKNQVTALLQSGKDQGACADLAASTIKEVEDAVSAQQKILNSLDTGSECHKEGQAAVDSAQSSLESANSALTDAQKAFADAENAPVSVPAKAFSTLKEGECGFFFGDSAYTSAKETFKGAKEALEKAKGTQKAAADALDVANKAWKAANQNNDENEKAYTKGKHMECVLEGTPPSSCTVGEVPQVTAPQLADDVPEHHCASFGARQT